MDEGHSDSSDEDFIPELYTGKQATKSKGQGRRPRGAKKKNKKTKPIKGRGKKKSTVGQSGGSNDGDPGWEDCEDNFSNPKSEKPFHEVPGPRRAASGLCFPLEYLKLFLLLRFFK